MTKIPFEKFILTFLILGKDISFIISKLNDFHYHIEEKEVVELFEHFKNILSPAQREKIDTKTPWSLIDETDQQWLEQLEIREFYDYMVRKSVQDIEPPEYFKWFRDCLWIHESVDTLALVNILMFNGENFESISDIISCRYKKKIGIDAFRMYQNIYWNTSLVSAREAIYHCVPFRKNALIIKNLKEANITTISQLSEDESDGSDQAFIFNDSNYIKWKIGYKKIEVPDAKSFMEKIKTDSYFKYYEAMNAAQSCEVEEESGNNDFGPFDKRTIKRRNVEEQKAKAAKAWIDIYLKANESIPSDSDGDEDFFLKMQQLSLGFEEEKLIRIEDMPDISLDIAGDK